jgi:hypothetical protein
LNLDVEGPKIPEMRSRLGFLFLNIFFFIFQILVESGAHGMSMGYEDGDLGTETLLGPLQTNGGLKMF